MSAVHSIVHLMRADFLERIRRQSFLIVLAVTVLAGIMMIPARGALYNAFVIEGVRGVYNSAWVGTVFGVLSVTFLSLIGFYLVKGAVTRDDTTRVGQIIATTPLSKMVYMLGKWLSNLAVLVVILATLNLVACLMQFVRAEDVQINLWALAAPIWGMGLPVLALVSALGVLFESIPLLRGSLGNVVYIFVWFGVLMLTAGSMFLSIEGVSPGNDVIGLSRILVDFREQMAASGLEASSGDTDLFVPTGGREVVRLRWDGIAWTARIFLERSMWWALAVALALVAAIPSTLLDPDRCRGSSSPKKRRWSGRRADDRVRRSNVGRGAKETAMASVSSEFIRLSPFEGQRMRRCSSALLLAELRLMVKGHAWWWYVVALGLLIASLACPLNVVQQYLLPAIWMWPITLWSALGNREVRCHTRQVVFSTAHVLSRQLLAAWLAGVLVVLITGGGVWLRFMLAGQWDHLLTLGVGAAFVPSFALALGVWSSSQRLFEAVYIPLWYLGAFASIPTLDFMGITPVPISAGVSIIFLVASVLLLGLAGAGRRRQVL